MTKQQTQDYLQDILDAVAAIEQFTTGIEFEAFSQNLSGRDYRKSGSRLKQLQRDFEWAW